MALGDITPAAGEPGMFIVELEEGFSHPLPEQQAKDMSDAIVEKDQARRQLQAEFLRRQGLGR